ncbi:MAG: hypothetical protein SF069_18020 [Phycisphaerae bacterium]|nr:hypothetical protein [Phycisphaerae bacterium]
MQRWIVGLMVGLLGVATASAQAPARKADRGIVLEGENKIRYILKQLELNPTQTADAESLLAVYSEQMKAESDQKHLISVLTEIQSIMAKRDEAKAAGDMAKVEEYNQQMKNLVPGQAPEKQFFEGLAPGLTDAQKKRLEATQERMKNDPDVSIKPTDVTQIAREQKLSKEQEEKLEKVNTEMRDEMTRSRPQSLAERVDRTDQFAKKVREILTPDQAKAFDAAMERMRPPMPANMAAPKETTVKVIKGTAIPANNNIDTGESREYTNEELAEIRKSASQPVGGPASQPASQPAAKP